MTMADKDVEEWVSWWFCFLDRNEAYFNYCEAIATNDVDRAKRIEDFVGISLADLYEDWGELWPIAFGDTNDPAWKAWFEPRRHLFIDKTIIDSVSTVADSTEYKPQAGHLLLDIPLAMTANDIVEQVRDVLKNYRRADYKAIVIPAKYQLYQPGIGVENLTKIENTYFILKNETSNSRHTFKQFIADNGVGSTKAPVGNARELLLKNNINEIDAVWDRQWVKEYWHSKKISYDRFNGIGWEYSWAALYGYFPCKLNQLEDELKRNT